MRAWALALLLLVAACGPSAAPKDTTPLDPTAEANAWIAGHDANKMNTPTSAAQADCIRSLYATLDQEHLRRYRPDGNVRTSDPVNAYWSDGVEACYAQP